MNTNRFLNGLMGNEGRQPWLLMLLAGSMLLFSMWIAFHYQFQPLLEKHAFRQTQTALTSFWMLREGWQLDYQTPVVGYPWSIPFEFPLYQSLVALWVYLTDWPLDATGRLVSYLFLAACALPAHLIARRLDLPRAAFWFFCALLWSSPIYLFWGRSFMIETAALFFSLMMIPYALDLRQERVAWRSVFFCILFGTLACLQKATTGGPVVLLCGFFWITSWLAAKPKRLPPLKNILLAALAFGIPILLTILWTQHTDMVKETNPFGAQNTSHALTRWNFGFFYQRVSTRLYQEVLWERMLLANAGGLLGAGLLFGVLAYPTEKQIRALILAALALFLTPIFIFTNLHITHDYYQAGCAVFLIGAVSIAATQWVKYPAGKYLTPFFALLLIGLNLSAFNRGYAKLLDTTAALIRSDQYVAARIVRENTPVDSGIVIFDEDWSSRIAYYAQRKAFTVSHHFKDLNKAMADPSSYLGPLPLSAVVICPSTQIRNLESLRLRYQGQANLWREGKAGGCSVFINSSLQQTAASP